MKNKVFAILAVVVLCLGALCACVPKDDRVPYEVWSTYNTVKVIGQTYKNDTYDKVSPNLSVQMMRGEYEGAQLIVTFNKGSGKVTLTKGELSDEKGNKIPDEAVSVYRQMYTQIDRNYNGGTTFVAGDKIPDMLLPEETAVNYGKDGYTADTNQAFTVEICN